jgi:hypothetical protein
MSCERCGRFSLFRRTCLSCAQQQRKIQVLEAGAHPDLRATRPAPRTRTTLRASVKLRLNGQDIACDLSTGLIDEILDEVAAKLNVSRDKARRILAPHLSPDRIAALTKEALEGKAATAVTTVNCPACQ